PGGTTGQDQFSGIVLPSNYTGANNNFGELKPASLSGFVYVDANKNGAKDSGEAGIGQVTVTLGGVDDLGNAVSLTQSTQANGSYSFTGLRPGTYTITEVQPTSYLQG